MFVSRKITIFFVVSLIFFTGCESANKGDWKAGFQINVKDYNKGEMYAPNVDIVPAPPYEYYLDEPDYYGSEVIELDQEESAPNGPSYQENKYSLTQ